MPRTSILILAAALVLAASSCQSARPADPPPPQRKMCGGIAGFQCSGGQYCYIEPGQCRTIADVAGMCRPKPQVCPMIYLPVCGCDGKTYANACGAASAGVSVAAEGACKEP
jgi:hypothetical protein